MKKVIIFLLFLYSLAFSQGNVQSLTVIQPEFYTLTLDSTTSSIVYYIYPPPSGIVSALRTPIGTTLPTSASVQANHREYNATGALTISMVTDTLTKQESDSLYAYCQTLIYDPSKATWYRSANDTLYLVFDTNGTYTQVTTIDYLDWTHGYCYTADLGDAIMPGAGLAITFGAYQNDNAGAATKLYLGFWWQR